MLLKLSKLCIVLLIFYVSYFQEVFFSIPNLLIALGFGVVFPLVILMFWESTPLSEGISVELVLWAAFAASSLFIGYLIVDSQYHLIDSITTLSEYLLLLTAICFVFAYDRNIDFIVKVFTLLALVCAITTVFWGQLDSNGRLSLTAVTNPNELGIILNTGIFCLLYLLNLNKRLSLAFVSAGILFFLYTIILTGSRKSLIAAVFLLLFWFIFSFRGAIKNITVARKAGAIVILVAAVWCFVYYLTPIFQDSVMLTRLTSLFEEGDATRIGMYEEAYAFFVSSPLFGIGYDNFRLLSTFETYSHSTFAEVFACTGLLGAFIYFSAYATMGMKTVWIILNKQLDDEVRTKALNILGLFLMLVFLATGTIHLYKEYSFIAFAMIIGFNKLHYRPEVEEYLGEERQSWP